ncbi:DJ-1 family protein [Texas Phoenix palm phytoplasma]|uniref:DJ-1 family protein n=1 Tax=Texas Phoenix palm phytoplasma TaxID=176709 RepID=A0ABS5BIS5_9MOLU|nr:DJ-1/PfpI family protein [Texas Phoenix palm phytoplasma]MBP3059477.1 DJ-1 family protein [Texas Phoenix palm phytoplasma]
MKKGLLILYNFFEDCEALVTRALLKKENFEVISATVNESLNVFSAQKLQVKADIHIDKVKLNEYDFLILPGGPYVQMLFEKNDDSLEKIFHIIKYFAKNEKIIGAICAAPSFLGKLDLLKKHKFTCYPGYQKYIFDGFYYPEKSSVTSGNFVTARDPKTVFDFTFHLLKKLQN